MGPRAISLKVRMAVGFALVAMVLAVDVVSTALSSRDVSTSVRAAEQEHLPNYVAMESLQRRFVGLLSDFERTLFLGERSGLDACLVTVADIEDGLTAQAKVGGFDHRHRFSNLREKLLRYSKTSVALIERMLVYDGSAKVQEEINRLSVLARDRQEVIETEFEGLVALRRGEFDAALDTVNTGVRRHAWLGTGLGAILLVLWVFSLLEVHRRVVGPITRLSRFATNVSRGEVDRELPKAYDGADEVGLLWRDFVAMIQSLRTSTVSREYVESIFRSMTEAVIVLDEDLTIRSCNPATAVLLGVGEKLPAKTTLESIWPDCGATVRGIDRDQACTSAPLRTTWMHTDGSRIPVSLSVTVLDGASAGVLLVAQDMREHIRAEEERLVMERQLLQSSKLEAVGQLAAGIAHEINTPMQFIGDNTRFVQEGLGDFKRLIVEQDRLVDANREQPDKAELIEAIDATREEIDYEFLVEETESAVTQSLSGVERVTEIVRAMKEFSHPGTDDKAPADLNRIIRNATTVSRTEWKYAADLDLDLDESLPMVPCLSGPLSQTILNLVVNAAHAIIEAAGEGSPAKGTITIRTRQVDDCVEISVADTGCGMPEEVCAKVFEPFFTTKEVGKGTGQGLSIAHSTVVQKHGGSIEIESEVGRGTTFVLSLPLTTVAEPVGVVA